jgi:hypothetical protein
MTDAERRDETAAEASMPETEPAGPADAAAEAQGAAQGSAQSPPGEPPQAAAQPGAAQDAEAQAGEAEQGAQQIPLTALLASVPARELLATFCHVLAAKAWEGMGLVANPMSNKVEKNLEDARVAIDAYAAVLEVLRVRLEAGPRQEMENVLTMLRVNFVDKSSA